MKKYIIIIFFLTINNTFADVKIAYIDVNFVLNNSIVGKSLNDQMKSYENNHIKKFDEIKNNLIKKENDLISKKNVIDEIEFGKKTNLLQEEIKKYRLDRKISNEELNKTRIEYTKKILLILNPIVSKYVEDNKISLVLPKKNIVVGKKDLDITEDIMILLNNKVKEINF